MYLEYKKLYLNIYHIPYILYIYFEKFDPTAVVINRHNGRAAVAALTAVDNNIIPVLYNLIY